MSNFLKLVQWEPSCFMRTDRHGEATSHFQLPRDQSLSDSKQEPLQILPTSRMTDEVALDCRQEKSSASSLQHPDRFWEPASCLLNGHWRLLTLEDSRVLHMR